MENAIKKVVDYWDNVAFSDDDNWNNGTPEQGGSDMAGILASMLAKSSRGGVSPEARQKFKEVLTEKLEASDRKDLHCDYSPEGLLADAAGEAGIPYSCFPCKTTTQIRDGIAYGKCGYGKQMEEL